MKVIRLKKVFYLNWKGIVLGPGKTFIEATEENIEKLHLYLNNGTLEIIDIEQAEKDQAKEALPTEPIVMLDEFRELDESNNGITTQIMRIYEYTADELKELKKADLVKICEDRKIEIKKNYSVSKLEELILKNQ